MYSMNSIRYDLFVIVVINGYYLGQSIFGASSDKLQSALAPGTATPAGCLYAFRAVKYHHLHSFASSLVIAVVARSGLCEGVLHTNLHGQPDDLLQRTHFIANWNHPLNRIRSSMLLVGMNILPRMKRRIGTPSC